MKPTALALLFALMLSPAYPLEIRAGISAHDIADLWGHTKKESGADLGLEFILGRRESLCLRPVIGVSLNALGHTGKVYLGGLFQFEPTRGFALGFSLGGAIHTGELSTGGGRHYGSRVLFRISAEVGLALSERSRIYIIFDHISNGNLAAPNDGLDILGAFFGYRF